MEQQIEQPGIEETAGAVISHEHERMSDAPVVDDGPSELERHKADRAKPRTEPEPPLLPEAARDEKKPERWADPDTGDTYDMRHKVARRIKTVLEDRGKERARADAAERRIAELTQALIERGATPAQAERKAEQVVHDAEPDSADLTKYPEGQFDRAYIKDVAKWEARQATQGVLTEAQQQAQQRAQSAAQRQTITQWQQTLTEARAKYPDFDDAMGRVPDHPIITSVVMQSPVGNDLAYVFGSQPKALEMFERAPNDESRRRLVYHMEAQLLQGRPKGKPAPRTTQAPPPTDPVDVSGGPVGPTDWSRTDDVDQFQRWKAKRGQRR